MNGDYVSYRNGSDSFNSQNNTFERMVCSDEKPSFSMEINLTEAQKITLLNLANQDIVAGNEGSGGLDSICVSSFTHEISIHRKDDSISTTCLSFPNVGNSKVEDFIYSLPELQNLPMSQCRFY